MWLTQDTIRGIQQCFTEYLDGLLLFCLVTLYERESDVTMKSKPHGSLSVQRLAVQGTDTGQPQATLLESGNSRQHSLKASSPARMMPNMREIFHLCGRAQIQ